MQRSGRRACHAEQAERVCVQVTCRTLFMKQVLPRFTRPRRPWKRLASTRGTKPGGGVLAASGAVS